VRWTLRATTFTDGLPVTDAGARSARRGVGANPADEAQWAGERQSAYGYQLLLARPGARACADSDQADRALFVRRGGGQHGGR
jgi:hypothetical protein